jgi:hypothetical protein
MNEKYQPPAILVFPSFMRFFVCNHLQLFLEIQYEDRHNGKRKFLSLVSASRVCWNVQTILKDKLQSFNIRTVKNKTFQGSVFVPSVALRNICDCHIDTT